MRTPRLPKVTRVFNAWLLNVWMTFSPAGAAHHRESLLFQSATRPSPSRHAARASAENRTADVADTSASFPRTVVEAVGPGVVEGNVADTSASFPCTRSCRGVNR